MAANRKYLWLDLGAGDVATWHKQHSIHEQWYDHGAGILLTLAQQHNYHFDVIALSALHSWAELLSILTREQYDVIAMNVRSWRYIYAKRAAEITKRANPNTQIWVGGMHATVCRQEMEDVEQFDVIVSREAEQTWLYLLNCGGSTARFIDGTAGEYTDMDKLPFINRELWPHAPGSAWPLESPGGWGPGPRAATMLTGYSCPFHCSFCAPAESNHYGMIRRRSVSHVLGELQYINERWGPITTVVYHDSEFLIHKKWIEEYLERYPRETPNWPFWASVRADMMAKWPDLTEALIRQANWHTLSIGLESGSQKVLDIMNKQTTVEQNMAAIELVNRLGDELVAEGKRPPVIFANIMLGVPGEEPEDAFATMRMMATMKRGIPSLALFSPYPGSTLGDRMIAEGRSLDVGKSYHRFPTERKITGVDYDFYGRLLGGQYDAECGLNVRELMSRQGSTEEALV